MAIVDARIGRTSGARANQGLDSFFFRVGCTCSSITKKSIEKRLESDTAMELCVHLPASYFSLLSMISGTCKAKAWLRVAGGGHGNANRTLFVFTLLIILYALLFDARTPIQPTSRSGGNNKTAARAERKKDVVLLLMMMAPSRRIKILTFQNIKGHRSRIINADDQSSMHHIKLNTRW